MRQAEKEAGVILWDGGNNDTPFYASDLEIVIADPHRPGHELLYFPGEVNLRRADVVVINKVDTASLQDIETVRQNVRNTNPKAKIIETACRVSVAAPESIRGRRVLVVEDGPTLTHGEMQYGAGVVAARQFGAAELADPRPYAVGSLRTMYEKYPRLTNLLPAMGYNAMQMQELEETINVVPCDIVLAQRPRAARSRWASIPPTARRSVSPTAGPARFKSRTSARGRPPRTSVSRKVPPRVGTSTATICIGA